MPKNRMESQAAVEQVKYRWRELFNKCDINQLRKIVEVDQDVLDVMTTIDLTEVDEDLAPLSLGEFQAMAEEVLLSRGEK